MDPIDAARLERLRVAVPNKTPTTGLSGPQGDAVPTIGEIGLNQFAPYMLNRLTASWNGALGDLLKDADFTTTKFRALSVLAVCSGITVNELALFAVTEQSTMSRTLDVLEDQGLIIRRLKPDDMRVRRVFITETGINAFATLWPDVHRLYARFFEGIDETELRSFIATLQKVMRNVRNEGG